MNDPQTAWERMTPEEKKQEPFLERNAISKAQYDKSLGDLIEKMGIKEK